MILQVKFQSSSIALFSFKFPENMYKANNLRGNLHPSMVWAASFIFHGSGIDWREMSCDQGHLTTIITPYTINLS